MATPRTVLLGGIAAAVLLPLGTVGVVHGIAAARWRAMASWAEREAAAYAVRDLSRPVAWGETEPGNAFDDYRRALDAAQPLVGSQPLPQLWAERFLHLPSAAVSPAAPPLRDDEVAALLAAWDPALAALRAGAHRAAGGPALRPGVDPGATSLLAVRWLTNVAILQARAASARGDDAGAVGLVLDAATFAMDLLRSPSGVDRMIGAASLTIVATQGCDDAWLDDLDETALERLDAGFARLDDAALPAPSYRDETMVCAAYLLRHHEDPGFEVADLPRSWRYGFSSRWQLADAVLSLAGLDEPHDGGDGSWSERRRHLDALQAAIDGCRNPAAAAIAPRAGWSESAVRLALARSRCLRLAVAARRDAPLPALRDPLGNGPIACERTADGLRFRSEGEVGPQREPIARSAPAR